MYSLPVVLLSITVTFIFAWLVGNRNGFEQGYDRCKLDMMILMLAEMEEKVNSTRETEEE